MEKSQSCSRYKKGDKKVLKNYRLVFLILVCEIFFEKLIFNGMFMFFVENDLILSNQSAYKPGGSCTNQLLSIAHEITNLLIVVMMLEVFFLRIQKLLTRFNTMVSSQSWTKMVYLVICV